MKKKILSMAICFVMGAGVLAGPAMPAYAEDDICRNVLEANDTIPYHLVGSFRSSNPDDPLLEETYTFNENGTGTYEWFHYTVKTEFAVNGNELSITYAHDYDPQTFEFTVDYKVLTLTDKEGSQTVFYRLPDEEPDDEEGTVVVHDEVINGESTVPIETVDDGYVHCMYDPVRGEHFYTKDLDEVHNLLIFGWNHEVGYDFISVDATDEDAVAVYRLYNPNEGGMHFYTEDAAEAGSLIESGWNYEGIAFYAFDKDSRKGIPHYRTYNSESTNGEHNWTTSAEEHKGFINAGWADEDICWNVLEADGDISKEIVGSFRYVKVPLIDATYTFNENGTGTYEIWGEVINFTYTVYGNELSIIYEEKYPPRKFEITVDDEALTIIDEKTGAQTILDRI